MLSLLRCVCEKVFATSAQTSVCADSDCRGMSVPRLRTSGCSHVCMQMSTHRDFHNYSLSGSILSHFVFGLGTAGNSSFQNLSGKSAATSKARVKCHPFLPVIFFLPFFFSVYFVLLSVTMPPLYRSPKVNTGSMASLRSGTHIHGPTLSFSE